MMRTLRQREGGPTAGDEFRVGGQVQDTTSRSGKAVALEAVTVAFNVADRGVYTAVERADLNVA
ncbi:hypothetical protein, partial [Klebsiella michiganensis]|uniref:hypothetical protein n=1 Tax=Klebsiella michiganensis TaxID=1134687 RepID=UPI001953CF49